MSKSTIQIMLQRPIAYHAIVAKAFDNVKLAILWSQLYYWSDRTTDPEGWIYKTQEDIFNETGLSRRNQVTARTEGKELGVIQEEKRGVGNRPSVLHFRVDLEKSLDLIEKYIEANPMPEIKKVQVHAPRPKIILELPEWLNKQAWADWEKYRSEKGQGLKPSTVKLQLAMLGAPGNLPDHVEIINQSIRNGWTGLFALKGQQKKPVNAIPATAGKYANVK